MKLEKQEERFKKLFYYPRSFNQFLFPHPHTLSPYPAARTRLRPHSLPPIPHSGSLESRVRVGEVEVRLGGIRQLQSLKKLCNRPKDNHSVYDCLLWTLFWKVFGFDESHQGPRGAFKFKEARGPSVLHCLLSLIICLISTCCCLNLTFF